MRMQAVIFSKISSLRPLSKASGSMSSARLTRGTLIVRGTGLHLQMLSLEGGQVSVDGRVDSLTYEEPVPAGGFFARLFG